MRHRTFSLAPLDLGRTLSHLRRGSPDPTTAWDGREFWRATRTDDGPGTIRLVARPGIVEATAWGPGAAWLLEHAPSLCGADNDVESFVPRHALIGDLHRRFAGMRLGRTDAVVESLVPSIIEQKVTGIEAFRSYAALVRRYGEPAPGPAKLLLPPAPATLAALPYYAFHPLGIERRRADAVRHACARASRLEDVRTLPLGGAYRRLQSLPGVGAWTAAEVARNALGDPDAVSVGDFHLPSLVAWNLAGEPRAGDARMLEILEPYRGSRARVIRLLEAGGATAPRFGPRKRLRRISTM